MLLTEVRPLSRLPDIFLLSQGPIQDTTWHLVIVAQPLLAVTVSHTLLTLDDRGSSEACGCVFCGVVPLLWFV